MSEPEYVPEYRGELARCPFCNSQDIDPKGWMSGSEKEGYRHGPACDDCGGSADSVERWNTRTTPPEPATKEALVKWYLDFWASEAKSEDFATEFHASFCKAFPNICARRLTELEVLKILRHHTERGQTDTTRAAQAIVKAQTP